MPVIRVGLVIKGYNPELNISSRTYFASALRSAIDLRCNHVYNFTGEISLYE